MRELSRDKCFGCGCNDCYLGVGFLIYILTPIPPDPDKGTLGGHSGAFPMREDFPGRHEYKAWLCTRCGQLDELQREMALAVGDHYADDLLRSAGGWVHTHQTESAWTRVWPATLAHQRAKEKRGIE